MPRISSGWEFIDVLITPRIQIKKPMTKIAAANCSIGQVMLARNVRERANRFS
jgi:hypothetical protein